MIGPAQSLLTARESHVLHLLALACLRRDGSQHSPMHGVHLEQAELLLGAIQHAAPAVRFRSAGAGPLQRKPLVGARALSLGSGATKSPPLAMIKGSLSISIWWGLSDLLVCTLTGLLMDRVRDVCSLVVCVCFLERGRDGGCWSWVVFECPCVSVVSGSFLMNRQTTQTIHSEYSQAATLFMLAVLLVHRQLPALACTKLRSKVQGRSHQCASQLRWETR